MTAVAVKAAREQEEPVMRPAAAVAFSRNRPGTQAPPPDGLNLDPQSGPCPLQLRRRRLPEQIFVAVGQQRRDLIVAAYGPDRSAAQSASASQSSVRMTLGASGAAVTAGGGGESTANGSASGRPAVPVRVRRCGDGWVNGDDWATLSGGDGWATAAALTAVGGCASGFVSAADASSRRSPSRGSRRR